MYPPCLKGVVITESYGFLLLSGFESCVRELEHLHALRQAADLNRLVVLQAVLEVNVDMIDDLVLVEIIGIIKCDACLTPSSTHCQYSMSSEGAM